jgi:hypothetical protein
MADDTHADTLDGCPVVAAVAATLTDLGADPTTNARACLALTLAATLDAGAGSQVAAVSRELRLTLDELATGATGDDELDRFIARLSTPQ